MAVCNLTLNEGRFANFDVCCVPFDKNLKSYFQFSIKVALVSPEKNSRVLAPRNEFFVLIHICDHFKQLLWREIYNLLLSMGLTFFFVPKEREKASSLDAWTQARERTADRRRSTRPLHETLKDAQGFGHVQLVHSLDRNYTSNAPPRLRHPSSFFARPKLRLTGRSDGASSILGNPSLG
eukprot:scaffold373_cov350-Pavlova_lutheri.AAC.42